MLQTLERRIKYIDLFLSDERTTYVTNILVTGDSALHRKRVCLQKINEGSIFKYNIEIFRNSPYSHSHLPANLNRSRLEAFSVLNLASTKLRMRTILQNFEKIRLIWLCRFTAQQQSSTYRR